MINKYTCSWHCSSGTYFFCFPLALANTHQWPLVPLFEIYLKNSELKTTHNTFRDCRVHFFPQPFSRQLYINSIYFDCLQAQRLHFLFGYHTKETGRWFSNVCTNQRMICDAEKMGSVYSSWSVKSSEVPCWNTTSSPGLFPPIFGLKSSKLKYALP